MRYVISYDITDERIRRRIMKLCKAYGQRVQYSIFECELTRDRLTDLLSRLDETRRADGMDPSDSIRAYRICDECAREVVVLGYRPKIVTEVGSVIV